MLLMKVGFTGTRRGMSLRQLAEATRIINDIATEVRHGDCVGADEQVHIIAVKAGVRRVVHPPSDSKNRAWCGGFDGSIVMPAKPYLERNRDIVDACDMLVAAPYGPEKVRSGTWATVRYARKVGKAVLVLKR